MLKSKNLTRLAAGIVAVAGIIGAVQAADKPAAPAAAAAAPAAASTGADEAAIRAQSVAWIKAYNAGDAKAIAALYSDDAMLMPPDAPSAVGKAAILAFITKDIAESKKAGMTFAIDGKTDVGVSGDTGWESGTMKAMIKGAVVGTGKFLSVSHKKDGKWLYLRDTYNMNAPAAPPTPPAAPAAPAAPAKPAAPAAPAAAAVPTPPAAPAAPAKK